MYKTAVTMTALAVIGTAAAVAYGCMKPSAKQQLKRDMKNTAKDMAGVRDEMVNVGQDVTDMARNVIDQM